MIKLQRDKVLLVDADSKIPNLPLMKLSTYYKGHGYSVDFKKLNLGYYPWRVNHYHFISSRGYEKAFCSIVFTPSAKYILGDENVEFGGSGYSLKIVLPDEVEICEPDYTLYPDNDTSYGFLSRGCIRDCYFCIVPKKEGKIHQVSTIDDIVRHDKVCFLDNNILALSNHKDLLTELIDKRISCQFSQGLDIRLVDKENSELLRRLKYYKRYIFAFDNWKDLPLVEKGLSFLNSWRRPWKFMFYVYVNPNNTISEIVKRIEYLRNQKIVAYIIRDITCWNSPFVDFYNSIVAWANHPARFIQVDFETFAKSRGQDNMAALYKENK